MSNCYPESQKKRIDHVKEVFSTYIMKSRYIDLLYSDKLGYILLYIEAKRKCLDDAILIESDRQLCKRLFEEVVNDTLLSINPDMDKENATEEDWDKVRSAIAPYIEKLPEYGDILDELGCAV